MQLEETKYVLQNNPKNLNQQKKKKKTPWNTRLHNGSFNDVMKMPLAQLSQTLFIQALFFTSIPDVTGHKNFGRCLHFISCCSFTDSHLKHLF